MCDKSKWMQLRETSDELELLFDGLSVMCIFLKPV